MLRAKYVDLTITGEKFLGLGKYRIKILVEESNPELPEGDRKHKWFVEDVVYTEPIEVVK